MTIQSDPRPDLCWSHIKENRILYMCAEAEGQANMHSALRTGVKRMGVCEVEESGGIESERKFLKF